MGTVVSLGSGKGEGVCLRRRILCVPFLTSYLFTPVFFGVSPGRGSTEIHPGRIQRVPSVSLERLVS